MGVLFCFEQKSDALYQREIDEENTKRSVSKFSGSVLVLVRVQCGKQFRIVSIQKYSRRLVGHKCSFQSKIIIQACKLYLPR